MLSRPNQCGSNIVVTSTKLKLDMFDLIINSINKFEKNYYY
jgi:hypothetical protein